MDYSILSRSYDLRGIYPIEINEDFYRRLGYAFVAHTQVKKLVLGYDARLSSVSLKQAFIEGALFHDVTVVDIGLCSSDMLSFATCYYPDIEV
jgi:phosphomannomutase